MNIQHRIWELQDRIQSGCATRQEIKELDELEMQRLELFISLQVLTGNWQVRERRQQIEAEQAYSRHLTKMRSLVSSQ
jgi:hypothetical protein